MQLKKNNFIRLVSLYRHNSRGVAAVEFALVFIPFILLLLFTMELSRVIYLYAAIDLSLSEASQQTSNSGTLGEGQTNYEELFNVAFRQNVDKTPLLLKDEQVDITIKYCDNIDQIISDRCDSNGGNKKPLAVYNVVYHYKPLFFIFPSGLMESSLARNIVYVQEYERDLL